MRPIIGITARQRVLTTSIGEQYHFTLLVHYVEAVAEAGGVPIVLPHTENSATEMLSLMNGLLLTGGGDIAPRFYGEEPHPTVDRVDEVRDHFEIAMVRQAMEWDIPVLAICRGIQVLNVAAGGTLFQDIDAENNTSVPHRQQKPPEEPTHLVQIAPDSKLAQVLGVTRLLVNSGHHQAVKAVAPGFLAVAWAEDGIIEGLESPHHRWIIGVQWHPEMMFRNHPEQARLFAALVEESRRREERL